MSANLSGAKIVSSLVIGSWIGTIGLGLALGVGSVVLAVPGFAQSDMLRASNLSSTDVVRVYVPVDARPAWSVTLPPNLTIPDIYRSYVTSMLRLSPTFRRQCVRIANALGLTVVLRQFLTRPPERLRARTSFWTARDGRRYATVEIGLLDDQVELIAHEIEHVIERLDGVDLRARAALPGTGVHQCDGSNDAFETIRATRAGLAVAQEVRRAPS
jgi:hypothetical protein